MRLSDFQKLCDRLSPYCRHALEAAVLYTRERTHYEVGIEHFLSKLLEDPNCDLGLICRGYGVNQGDWLAEVARALDRIKSGSTSGVHWTEDVIKLVERAWMFASTVYSVSTIRSGFILLALLAMAEEGVLSGTGSGGLAAESGALASLAKHNLRDDLRRLVEGSSEGSFDAPSAAVAPTAPASAGALERFTVNLNELARTGKLDRAIGRDKELRQLLDILSRRRKNNAILVGEPGVGKTAVVEGLALRIIEGDVPVFLRDTDVLSLDLGLLQAGAGVKGEFETRIKQVLTGVKSYGKPVILFIDEAHLLIGAGNQAGGGDAANLLKPALARGELRSIAATTWAEYKKYIEKDAALQDRFELIKIDEPEESRATDMLRGTKDAYEKFHAIQILDEGLEAAVKMSNRYLTGRQLPRKAVDLLDTAAARVKIGGVAKPPVIEDLERRLENLQVERSAKQRDHDHRLTDYARRIEELDALIAQAKTDLDVQLKQWEVEKKSVDEYVKARAALDEAAAPGNGAAKARAEAQLDQALKEVRRVQGRTPLVPIHLDEKIVARVIADWTGIPVGNMIEEELPKILDLENRLKERVRGQDHALKTLAETIRTSKAGLNAPTLPIGVFLLVGPSGTGKTETALALAETLFGGERFATTINMSEYKEEHTISLLIGSPPGYVGYGEGGVLTEAVRQRPYNVVLLDEIEKAHRQVLELFYQIFDKGYCEDRTGRYISFRNTIILMTSNLDSERITQMCTAEPLPSPEELLDAIRPTLSEHFKPALLARFRVIPYYPLGTSLLRQIVQLKLDRVGARLRETYGITLTYTDALADHIVSRCGNTELGARQLDQVISEGILPRLSWELLGRTAAKSAKPRRAVLDLEGTGSYRIVFEEGDTHA